ncbi:C4-dicarboxylate TRAP transporter substrate-binding protein [Rhabdaerophilum calidifontis]|uniref:C4-dicarboxylate TRAP transporter substrate-binding protein n=1 Tax=Rhabdaerophilum calidifontis TaxID=2604328 RepID=UPI001FE5FD1B|nr:C4-dicarboxylate TRAP transporter substrate-binding protein [Rhabdaerophilum calidifontis]
MRHHLSKRMFGALVAGAALLGLGAAAQAQHQLNINTALTRDDPIYKGLERMRDEVAKRSNNQLTIRIFPGSQLGKDEDVLEQARAGANVAVVVDGGRLAVFVKEFGILSAPYVASGFDGIRKVVTSPMFEEWAGQLRKASGHQVLSFNWWQGERHLLTNKPIKLPADLAGVRLRTPGAPVWMETIRAMGATPTPLAWGEVYPALQQKVIDAAEAQHPATFGARLYEVTKNLTKTGHFNLITGIVTSAQWFDKLPPDLQKILREESLAAGDFASRLTQESLAGLEEQMKAKGMAIAEIDKAPFVEATKGVYEKLGYADLKTKVDAILK